MKRTITKRRNTVTPIIMLLAIIVMTIFMVRSISKYPEQYSTIVMNSLRMELNEGNADAIERYKSVYIENDKYLFNGPLTIELCAEKYNLNFDEVYNDFINSGYDNFQNYFDIEIK